MPNWFTDPLLPQSAVQPIQDKLTEPSLTQSPWMAALKGFGAGALEGVRGLTSPAMIGGMLMDDVPLAAGAAYLTRGASTAAKVAPEVAELSSVAPEAVQGLKGAMSGVLGSARDILNPRAEAAIQRMAESSRPVMDALKKAGAYAGERVGITAENAAEMADRFGKARQPAGALGFSNPEFTPVGSEADLLTTAGTPGIGARSAAGTAPYNVHSKMLPKLGGQGF
jgi:hypothetical protein